jgi:sialic acid synthase
MAIRELHIGQRLICDDAEAYVIAEIGHNHEGDLRRAELMVRRAAEAGAQAVKLQKRYNRGLFTKAMYDQPYPGRNSFGPTYGAHREALEFRRGEYQRLAEVAAECGVDLLATAFDVASVDFLVELGLPAIKIASGDLTNIPLLCYASKAGVPLIVSTGGADLEDVQRSCDAVRPINPQLAVLQCTAVYPAAQADLNLSVIAAYRRQFPDLVIGFSGHDDIVESSWTAYALGARIIEKHFTLDRTRPGSDQFFSLEPGHLAELVSGLRRVRESLGSPVKCPLPAEAPALYKMGKKLVAARDLPAGLTLTSDDVAVKSPGDGLKPYQLTDVLGRRLRTALPADGALSFEILG